MRPSPVLAALIAGSALCLATGVAAQGSCDLLQSRSSTVQVTGDGFFNFISDPVFGCEGGVIIRADSAVLDDVSGYTRFIGNFEYSDSAASMTADRADHFASEGRLIGVGNVHIIDGASGATFEGDSTVLVGSSSRREDGEMTILGLDGRRAHAVILVTPQAGAADSTEPPPDSAAAESDSTEAADSPEAPPDSAATENDPADAAGTGGEMAPEPEPSPPDTTPVPYDIDAERIYLSGADYMLATGNAELYNDEFRALADSIEYRETTGKLFLRGTAPRVFGYGAEYVLSGDAVDLDMNGNQVAARGDAALSGSEIDLTAPEIRVLMVDGVLDRIVAMNERPPEPEPPGLPEEVEGPSGDSAAATAAASEEQAAGDVQAEPTEVVLGEAIPLTDESVPGDADAPRDASGETADSAAVLPPARPRAVAETFELEGDSIHVLAPDEVLERVVAVGDARGESLARDSLNTEDTPEIARSDWVSGDTITAVFQPVGADTSAAAGAQPATDESSGGYQLDRLVARGQAASLYRLIPSEGGGEGEPPQPDAAGAEAGEQVAGEGEEQAAEEAVAEEEVSGDPAQEAATEEDPGAREPTGEAGGEEAAAQPEPDIRLALHYVRGDLITIFMQDGEVTSVIVEGNAQGVQLEPLAPPPADTTATADTTAAPPATRR
ncbi:MAG: hypothetical protein OXR82_03565 [Gammaproteobacteria bacterium]|nr:hypothetical protein [Gammaproteobacteria bacterium]MDE0257457.1 hypothetical protein [Gammaproteobacteria bacterium]